MEPTPKKRLGGYKAKPKRKHYERVKPLAPVAPLINPAFTALAPTYTVTTDGPVNLGSPLPLATWTAPLSLGLDLQFQLQLSAQVVPSSTTQADNQITIRADAAQAIANWILENPGQALLWGGGLVIGVGLLANLLDSLSQPQRRRISR